VSTLLQARVRALAPIAPGIAGLELEPAGETDALPAFDPGAHVDLHLPNGLVRSYSLANPPHDHARHGRYLLGIALDPASRGGSRYVHEQLRPGQTLPMGAPRNLFALDEQAPHSVLVAGGIGVTPLYCMQQALAAQGRSWRMIYAARSRREAAFAAELQAAAAPGQLVLHFDDERGGPPDLAALLAGAIDARHGDAGAQYGADAHYYCCGPAPMIAAFEQACAALGYCHVHVERFAPARPAATGAVSAGAAGATGAAEAAGTAGANAPADGFDVVLARSGATLFVPAGKSILDALLDAGIAADYGCTQGVCGACETRVLEGEIEHLDDLLPPADRAAGRTMMICVSRCRGARLVLDL